VVKLTADEIPFAKEALFSRNPIMKEWPPDHRKINSKITGNKQQSGKLNRDI
jgi:hypothetical protein